jgi:GNAT superfamily N-acetyltransferase
MKRVVAETETGEAVGVGGFNHLWFSYHPRRFAVSLEVHPNWQRRGVGGMLYEHLLSELRNTGAEAMWPLVLSDSKPSVTFLTKRGFVEKRRLFESRLDLTSFNPEVARAKAERLEAEGIVVSDLASEMDEDPDVGKKLFDLEQSASGDVPSLVEFCPMDYGDYEIIILKNPILVWEGSFVAKEGDRFVGSSSVQLAGRDDFLHQGFTAVRPGYRGRGIAQAVKVKVAEYCRMHGMRYLRTYNDSDNLPMLAVNWKIGFVKQYEWIASEKMI